MKGQILVEEPSSSGPGRSGQQEDDGHGGKNAAMAYGDPQHGKFKFHGPARGSPDSSQGLNSGVQGNDGLSNIYYKGGASAA